ncbi:MAG: hypothetical protein Kow0010_13990 [Dehalococcoidia bacterium]
MTLHAGLLIVAALLAGGAAMPAVASSAPADPAPIVREWHSRQSADDSGPSTEETVIWAVIGVGLTAATLGTLYLLKRQLGGFPEHPTWVAPISIIRSSDLPDETTFADERPPAGGGHH